MRCCYYKILKYGLSITWKTVKKLILEAGKIKIYAMEGDMTGSIFRRKLFMLGRLDSTLCGQRSPWGSYKKARDNAHTCI